MAKKISSLSVVLGATVAPFVNAFKGAGSAVTGFVSRVGSAGAAVLKFTGIAGGVGAVLAAFGGIGTGIKLASDLEQIGVAFETMLGSAAAAQGLMGELKTFASATPFQFPEIAGAAKMLLGMGVSSDVVTDKLRMLGDISAGTGKPLGELAAIYGKIKSRGQLTGETLNQLAEAGVPIYRALAGELGVAESSVASLVSTGAVGFGKLDAALAGLTAAGGTYAGLTEKQSKTLGGLWSTLTDSVGLSMAGIVSAAVDAFGLKGGLASLTGALDTAGTIVTQWVQYAAPLVKSFAITAYETFASIYAAVAPPLTATFDYVVEIWQAIGGVIFAAGSQIYDAVVGSWGSVRDFTGSVFGTIVEGATWFKDQVVLAFRTVEYSILNWRTTLDMIGTQMALALVTAANVAEYYLVTVIPAYVVWFGKATADTFRNLHSFTTAVFTSMGKNIVAVFSNLPGLINGSVNLADIWTPLTEGFEYRMAELPQIADRQIGAVEQVLTDDLARIETAWGKGLGEHLEAKAKGHVKASEQIGRTLANVFKVNPIPAPPAVKVTANTSAIDELPAKAKKAAGEMNALLSGSAEAMRARVQANVAVRAAPPPAAATQASREGAKQTSLQEKMVTFLAGSHRALQDLVAKGGGTLAPAEDI